MQTQKSGRLPGVIKVPIFGVIKQYKFMAILQSFLYNNALFGLVLYRDP